MTSDGRQSGFPEVFYPQLQAVLDTSSGCPCCGGLILRDGTPWETREWCTECSHAARSGEGIFGSPTTTEGTTAAMGKLDG